MIKPIVGAGSQYMSTAKDNGGAWLDGGRNYPSSAEFSKRTKGDNAFVNRVLEGPKVWVIGVGDSILVNA